MCVCVCVFVICFCFSSYFFENITVFLSLFCYFLVRFSCVCMCVRVCFVCVFWQYMDVFVICFAFLFNLSYFGGDIMAFLNFFIMMCVCLHVCLYVC